MVNLADFGGPQFKPNEPGPGGHGQQGTLFSNRRLNRANRTGDEVGHKGFSPNRLAEVRRDVHVDVKMAPYTPPMNAALSGIEAAGIRKGLTDEDTLPQRQDVATRLTADLVHQNVARSSVPARTLQHPTQVWGGVQERGTQVSVTAMNGSVGDYNPGTGRIRIDHRFADSSAVIHEIGHQQDWLEHDGSERPGVSSGAADLRHPTPEKLARVEGFADAFADRHFRPRPGSAQGDGGGSYDTYSDEDWAGYAGNIGAAPGGGGAAAYSDTRKRHGGRDLTAAAEGIQQLQMGTHLSGVADINDRSWEPALRQRTR